MNQDPQQQPPNQPFYESSGVPTSYGPQFSGYQPPNQPFYNPSGVPPFYGPLPSSPQKKSRALWIILSVIGGLVLLSCIGSICLIGIAVSDSRTSPKQSNHITIQQTHQTATAQVTAHQSYLSSLSGNGKLVFSDPLTQESGSQWGSRRMSDTGGACLFTAGTYHVSQQTKDYFNDCLASGTFSNFAFEVQLTITQGNCGGMVFRHDNNGYFYFFKICQDGRYHVDRYAGESGSDATILLSHTSATINPGLGQQNKIAVVAVDNTMTFYVNEQQINQVQDSSYTSGSIGLIADPEYENPTDVAYTNAKLWTR